MTKTNITLVALAILLLGILGGRKISQYNYAFHTPVVFQKPLTVTKKVWTETIRITMAENVSPLTPDQQYACNVFGKDCKIFLAIAHAENSTGQCDIYNVNTDGSLDWGFAQINTVHLKNVNLKALLDCHANIDFAYKLYKQQGNFSAWSTFKSGTYKKYLY